MTWLIEVCVCVCVCVFHLFLSIVHSCLQQVLQLVSCLADRSGGGGRLRDKCACDLTQG